MKINNCNVLVDSYLSFLDESTKVLSIPDKLNDANPVMSFKRCMTMCDTGVVGSEAFHCVNKCKALLFSQQIDKLKNYELSCKSKMCKKVLKKKIDLLNSKLKEFNK